jgi:hypothetical protein
MHTLSHPVGSLPGILFDYMAGAFAGGAGTVEPVLVSGAGMPADTIMLEAQSVVLGFTCVAAPMFRAKVERLAVDRSIDVMLVRCCMTSGDLLPIAVDVVLAGGGLAPFRLDGLALYRHIDGGLWLVPGGFGGAIRLELHGLELYLVPPYDTLAERAAGIYRTAAELAALLYPNDAF